MFTGIVEETGVVEFCRPVKRRTDARGMGRTRARIYIITGYE